MCRRCHHLIGDPVRFSFVDIPRLVHREVVLQTQTLLPALLAFFVSDGPLKQERGVTDRAALQGPADGLIARGSL
jgi:hypothetical protein